MKNVYFVHLGDLLLCSHEKEKSIKLQVILVMEENWQAHRSLRLEAFYPLRAFAFKVTAVLPIETTLELASISCPSP
jgi:hypothetical protein